MEIFVMGWLRNYLTNCHVIFFNLRGYHRAGFRYKYSRIKLIINYLLIKIKNTFLFTFEYLKISTYLYSYFNRVVQHYSFILLFVCEKCCHTLIWNYLHRLKNMTDYFFRTEISNTSFY